MKGYETMVVGIPREIMHGEGRVFERTVLLNGVVLGLTKGE